MEPLLLTSPVDDGVVTLTLNRPDEAQRAVDRVA